MLTPRQGLFVHRALLRVEVHRKLGGSAVRTADPTWPKGPSTPHDTVPSVWTRGVAGGKGPLLMDRLGIHQWVVSNCTVHHSFCAFFYSSLLLYCPIKMSFISTHEFYLLAPTPILLPIPPEQWEKPASGCMVLSCQLGLNHDNQLALVFPASFLALHEIFEFPQRPY